MIEDRVPSLLVWIRAGWVVWRVRPPYSDVRHGEHDPQYEFLIMNRNATARSLEGLVAAGVLAPERAASLERVAERYAIAVTP